MSEEKTDAQVEREVHEADAEMKDLRPIDWIITGIAILLFIGGGYEVWRYFNLNSAATLP